MKTRNELLTSIATTIQDYRAGEIAKLTSAHVDRWVKQFDTAVQEPLLCELDHVLTNTYISRANVTTFLTSLLTNQKLVGDDPCNFWKGVHFLNNQSAGNSQREMLALFDSFLKNHCGFQVAACGKTGTTYAYLDDAVFTGNRVLKDISTWIQVAAPAKATVHVITIAYHRGGQYYAENKIAEVAKAAKKDIKLTWWTCVEIEDTKAHINTSDVLRPTHLPADALVTAYVATLKYPVTLRTPGNLGVHKFFSSENGRDALEQELLKAGARIRDMCPHLNKYQRPLGNMVLETLGFGSTIVTFRNCPNNAPLAFWAGNPWYPLFDRKTN